MKNFREIEQLSAYLDGQLNPTESARLESRIESDPELASVLSDLRSTRGLLRKLPKRKSPRNFTLTRKMVGLKPPLPRTYPLFRLATVFATILFVASFSLNALSSMGGAAAPAAAPLGIGGGGGGGCSDCGTTTEQYAATEAPSLEMAPAATEAPAESAADSGPAVTEEATRIMDATATPEAIASPKEAPLPDTAMEPAPDSTDQTQIQNEAPFSIPWTMIFLSLSILGGISMALMRLNARRKWQ
ncbi:MAG TPA: hypothetical protein PKL78_01365 [Anaerolineales bacterium]|nr:hypothetical protein [Anaerolineales bacterium]